MSKIVKYCLPEIVRIGSYMLKLLQAKGGAFLDIV